MSDGDLTGSTTLIIFVSDSSPLVLLNRADFEFDTGDWTNGATGDNQNRLRNAGSTSSSSTGPAGGADGSPYYMYMETSSGYAYYAGDTAILHQA